MDEVSTAAGPGDGTDPWGGTDGVARPAPPDPEGPADHRGLRPAVIWCTGLPGSGKTTVALAVHDRLRRLGVRTVLLDGDTLRRGLNRDLGFSDRDREENVRRAAEVAALMAGAGLVVVASFISPFRAGRAHARSLMEPGTFLEVFVDTPPTVAESRDPKGHYARARRGELPDFTGVDSPYEAPTDPDVRVDTLSTTPDEAAATVVEALRRITGSGAR
jgi:bifunctional enzyme CysN/CysC